MLCVLGSTGSLYPISSGMRVDEFEAIFAEPLKKLGGGGWEIVKDPDYLCFVAYSFLVFGYADRMLPDAMRVDFLIEHSQKTTDNIKMFRTPVEDALLRTSPELLKLLGSIDAEDKKSIPLQAADVLCWYIQRKESGSLDGIDERRFSKLVKRRGYRHTTKREFLQEMSTHLQDGMRKLG